jgi:transmembrane sensor
MKAADTQDRIDTEAANWLAAIDCGSADRQAFEQWRAKDPAHALAFIRVSQIAAELASIGQAGLGDKPLPISQANPPGAAPLGADRRQWLKLGLAAVVAAGLGGLGWTYSAAAHEAQTAVGERRRIVIARGIAVELNTDSRIKWRERDGRYEVELVRGEVMVERQPGAPPCDLDCGQSQIRLAPGGRLNARARPLGVDLSVVAGEISLKTPDTAAAIRVSTLRQAKVIAGAPPTLSALSPLEAGVVSAWQQGQLHFNGERLQAAVAEYNRYLSRPMEISDPAISQLRLGGRFSATDPTDFCRALKEIYGVSAHIEPDRIVLTRA